ncbi:FHA domain-containing protein [Planctomicrobium sp. SH527]|uniref:FHA domain-containing protein n=1 Tax=Planctomicrobium sp. SH527 TaxID=3448123 RepID=UPI003F5B6579
METASSASSGFVLVIERGRSQFPRRPIEGNRFLIGSGSNCHLQLGGQIPILHSIIIPQGSSLWIDAFVSDPPLKVNGQTIRESELHRGDLIEIGTFAFTVDQEEVALPEAQISEPQLSPEELLHVLANGLDFLQKAESGRESGARALLAEIARLQSAAKQPQAPIESQTAPVITEEVELNQEYSLSQLELMAQREAELENESAEAAELRRSA